MSTIDANNSKSKLDREVRIRFKPVLFHEASVDDLKLFRIFIFPSPCFLFPVIPGRILLHSGR